MMSITELGLFFLGFFCILQELKKDNAILLRSFACSASLALLRNGGFLPFHIFHFGALFQFFSISFNVA